MHRRALLSILLLAAVSTTGRAQANASASPNDSLFRRARRLVSEGNGSAGRALVDSVLHRETEGSVAYGDALYWRGALAETAADAERDYRRVIVEYPISLYADDALLAIAELEQARGDRAGALQHLQRFVREHPVSSARGVAALAAARLAFEQRDTRTGCAMIAEARTSASNTDVELRNQIDYFGGRCGAGDATLPSVASMSSSVLARDTTPASAQPAKVTAADATTSGAGVSAVTPSGKTTAKAPLKTPTKALIKNQTAKTPATDKGKGVSASPPRGIYTIQLAAYSTLTDAEHLIAKLEVRGVKARVSGTTKPFRVRLGFHATRQEAVDEVASLKQKGIVGFVTTEALRPGEKTP